MVSPIASSLRNSSQVAQSPTRFEFAIRTRGAHSWVCITPTGRPDWTSMVSSAFSVVSVRTIASNEFQSRAALPEPPYTTSSSGCSATSGSRLFCSIRRAASCCQPRAVSVVPRAARTGRGPEDMGCSLLVERAGDGLGIGEVGAIGNETDGVLDLGGQVTVGPRTFDVLPQRIPYGGGRRRRCERRAQVERAGGGQDLDREHPLEPVDRPAQLAGGRPAHRDMVFLHRA